MLMKIDSHQHFWYYNPEEYAWIGSEMSILKRDYLPDDLLHELQSAGVDATISVQARQNLEETKWLLELASKYSFIAGVVGWVDLCSSEIETQLAELSKNPKLVGVRHVIHDEPDPGFMARPEFQRGIGLLSKYKLTFDLLLFPTHLSLAIELVKKFPEQLFVLDHIAKPLIKDRIHTPWDKDIKKLAEFQNVYCKLSGMVTEADWENWKTDDFTFYLDTVFNCFGEDRLMIGSDWPVCTLAGNYKQVLSIVTDYFKRFSQLTQNKIFGDNCKRFYLEK